MNAKTVAARKRGKIQPQIKKQSAYSDEDIEFIRRNYLKLTNKEIAKQLNKTVPGISHKAYRLGLTGLPGKNKLWIRGNPETFYTEEEKKFIRENYLKMANKELAEKLKKSSSGIASMITKLGLGGHPSRISAYSPREIIFIKKNYPLKGSHYVANALGRSPAAIKRKANELRVERQSLLEWNSEEIAYLIKWYDRTDRRLSGKSGLSKGKKRPSEIARYLHRSTQSVIVRARMIGLLKYNYRRWTNYEELYLIKNFRNMTYKQIGKHLDRTRRSVGGKVRLMKMIKMFERNWTPREKRILTRFYGKIPNAELANKLNRTRGSIAGRARFQKLNKKGTPDYTEREKDFIRKNYLKMTNIQIGRKLKRTKGAIAIMGMNLGLVGTKEKQQLIIKARKDIYTEEEKEFLRKNYLKMTNKQIARELNRPAAGIHDQAATLGLTGLTQKRHLWIRGNVETHYTEAEKNFIMKNYLKMTNKQLAAKLNRSVQGIATQIGRLGLSTRPERRKYMKEIRRMYSQKAKR